MEANGSRTYLNHVVQYSPEYSFCAGCTSCEVVCTLVHDGLVSPSHSRIFVDRDARTMVHTILSCQHCADHPCYDSCPKKGAAMKLDENGIVYIDESQCVGCGLCVKACVFTPPRINFVRSADKEKRKARKCDLCRTRPEGPACVEWCPVRCIGLSESSVAAPLQREA
ncbi:Fe-S-cluster-containing hydrogenase component 2 [Sporobacter termitidis DSM 10068]|uniref:Fe-S-cluster-containing hydrogenase component 2 n=1 Tax=Sporobacter termitidis DSM 10068 TaxID=1123282 RepID=A0A1M5X5P3_9FIRM|nr:4Fe-4S dicluster domain-containing protein [Sporobacter termitidis]SHH94523.1 Fe-S-cluster-containing hydrogenase component 2 [Sporobacter termitidis DSM 10068]